MTCFPIMKSEGPKLCTRQLILRWLYLMMWVTASGLWYFGYLVSLGKVEPPEGAEEGWQDPYPLPLRVLALVKWVLLVLFQVTLQ